MRNIVAVGHIFDSWHIIFDMRLMIDYGGIFNFNLAHLGQKDKVVVLLLHFDRKVKLHENIPYDIASRFSFAELRARAT